MIDRVMTSSVVTLLWSTSAVTEGACAASGATAMRVARSAAIAARVLTLPVLWGVERLAGAELQALLQSPCVP